VRLFLREVSLLDSQKPDGFSSYKKVGANTTLYFPMLSMQFLSNLIIPIMSSWKMHARHIKLIKSHLQLTWELYTSCCFEK